MKKLLRGFFFILFPGISLAFSIPEGGESHMFTITGYYSPLPNQTFYVTGSYEAEIALNGKGVAGADGTAVYPGMIAAPASFPFGTIICIPDFGCGKVHDRGGAIVKQGETNLAKHDRIDLWMGYGEEGLRRALSLGVKHVEARIFSETSDVEVAVDFTAPPAVEQILEMPNRPVFALNLSFGDTGDDVLVLQNALSKLGLYTGPQDGIYSQAVKEAVYNFQIQNYIIENWDSAGAGVFGPKTRERLALILYKNLVQERLRETWDKFHFDSTLRFGQRSQAVWKLQEFLVRHEFLNVAPTGYFGNATIDALKQFQLKFGIIASLEDSFAGVFEQKTCDTFNTLLEQEKENLAKEKQILVAYQKNESKLQLVAEKKSEQLFAKN